MTTPTPEELLATIASLTAERDELIKSATWPQPQDKTDQYSEAIEASHPLKNGSYSIYTVANEMVSNRHSKFSLIALVSWLIQDRNKAEAERDALKARVAELESNNFQKRTFKWIIDCFGGDMSARAIHVRKHRFLEEALELYQAVAATKEEALQLVEYVYGRPIGEVTNEIGGTLITLASLCESIGQDMMACGEKELARVNSPETIAKIRLKNANKPKFGSLPVSSNAELKRREAGE